MVIPPDTIIRSIAVPRYPIPAARPRAMARKLGLTKEEEPEKIEYDLMKVLPKDHWILWNIHIITLGRTICIARRPKCCECFLREECPGREA